MRCVSTAVSGIETRAWVHHIQRLMVLGNLALLAGVSPSEMVDWMWRSFIDGAEWGMLPNLLGMSLHADGGRMATKPYAAGGAYINRMSDYCRECDYNPKKRVGDDACPSPRCIGTSSTATGLVWAVTSGWRCRYATSTG